MPENPDIATRTAELLKNPETVVFGGDGEPKSPESTVAHLNDLLANDQLEPDNYSLGGSVEALEKRMADELGKEAAIWLPTGTLANHLALRHHCGVKSRVVLQEQSHIYHDEGDALAKLSGLQAIPLAPNEPHFTTDNLRVALDQATGGRVDNSVGVVSIESPVRRQAGQIVPWEELQALAELCHTEKIPIHLDGARLYMMAAATGIDVKTYSKLFDSVYVSMYKYFGAPFGAILAGDRSFIEGMYDDRRMFGSGLASGYMAAALALNGIDGFIERFASALTKAQSLFESLNDLSNMTIRQFEHGSNIFELTLEPAVDGDRLAENLLDHGIVLNRPNNEWPEILLHVNTTLLRQPNEEITRSFAAALAESTD